MEWLNFTNIKKMDYFKSRLNKGICKSLKQERPDDYNDFLYLFQTHHPEKETKLKDVIDLCIVNNKRNLKYYEVNLIKKDCSVEDISYRCCIIDRPKNKNLNDAMRYTIQPQIDEFKKSIEILKCEFCNSYNNIEIDHIKLFQDLSDDFLKNRKDIPVLFDDSPYNFAMFRQEDKIIKNEWFNYHKENAKLRCLCKQCNLSRNKTTLKKLN
jgi:hypothetical protein